MSANRLRRIQRARQTRIRIKLQEKLRLSVHKTNVHIYATIYSETNDKALVSCSTLEKSVKLVDLNGVNSSTTSAASLVGKRLAEKAKALGISEVAFDRSGFAYHGRVKALADAARAAGLKF